MIKKNKKIVMILTRNPFPVSTGRELILAQTISFLQENYEISILLFTKNNINKHTYKEKNINRINKLIFPSKIEILKNLFLRKKYSLQENLFFSKKTQKVILEEIKNFNPDIIYADMIRTGQYVEFVNRKKIIDIDDLLSIRYERFLKTEENSILGTFEYILPSFLKNILEKVFKKSILKYEIKKIKNREIEIVKHFDFSFLVSQKEVIKLKKLTGIPTIYTNTQAISSRKNIYSFKEKNHFLFIGNMNTAQNLSSLKMIIQEILPKLKIDYQLYIVGKYDNRTIEITRNNKNIKLLGFVHDLEGILKNIKLALMPIAFGTGIKTKILDCMSYGIPVLTNDIGNEGLLTKNGENIILIHDFKNINNKLKNILLDKNLLTKISKQGFEYINKYHNYEKLKENFLKTIQK